MEHPESHTVTATNGPRPAGKPGQCFYCRHPIGAQHEAECVCRQRTVKVRAVIEYVIAVPASFGESNILFHRNDSSWCKDNMLDELAKIDCLCEFATFSLLGEATAADEARQDFKLEEL